MARQATRQPEQRAGKNPSPEYTFYRTLFPVSRGGSLDVVTPFHRLSPEVYDFERARFPERFNLDRCATIFNAFIDAATLAKQELKYREPAPKVAVKYEFDNLLYRGEFADANWVRRTQYCYEHNIKLSNDGFLYSPVDAYKLHRATQQDFPRHHSEHWYILDRSAFLHPFAPIFKYAMSYFNEKEKKNLRIRLYYNHTAERMDLKIINDAGDALNITFEPGFPEYDFKDEWQTLEEDEGTNDVSGST